LVVAFFAAVAFVDITAGRGSNQSTQSKKTAVVAKKRAEVATA
jgi:hypothetical protein